MVAQPYRYPRTLLIEQSHEWNLAGSIVAPGQTAEGAFPVARLDGGGYWVASLNEVVMKGRDSVLAWRAFRTIANNGATYVVVPRQERQFAPFPLDGNGEPIVIDTSAGTPHSDGAFFSDGTGYRIKLIDAESFGNAALRATSMQIVFSAGGPLVGGEVFSIRHPNQGWRMYEIGEAADVYGTGVTFSVTFLPPLREAVPSGTAIEFERPCCTMRLLTPGSMNLRVERFPYGRQTAKFIEVFYRV